MIDRQRSRSTNSDSSQRDARPDSRSNWSRFLLVIAFSIATLFSTSIPGDQNVGISLAEESGPPVCWLHNPNDGESTDLFMRLEASSEHAEIAEVVVVSGPYVLGSSELEASEVSDFTINTDKLSPGVHLVTGLYYSESGQLIHIACVTTEIQRPQISASSNVSTSIPNGPSIASVNVDVTTGANVNQWCIVVGHGASGPVYNATFDRLLPLSNPMVAAVGALPLNPNGSTSFTVSVPVVSDANGNFPKVAALVYRNGKWIASRVISVDDTP